MVLQIGILLINNTGGLKDILALIWNDETVLEIHLKFGLICYLSF